MPQHYLPDAMLYSTLAAAAAAAVLLPAGEGWSHLLFLATVALSALTAGAYAYARGRQAPEEPVDSSLRPAIEWQSLEGAEVPARLLTGAAPLIALVADGELPHPELAATLAPRFADPSLAFVQGATRYDGAGGAADAFRLLAAMGDEAQAARSTIGAPLLTGHGALVSREALKAAWRPGDTWETLGIRLVAMGYTGRFERRAMALTWAPGSVREYGPVLARAARQSLRVAFVALSARNLPLEARATYAAAAAAPWAVWSAALCGALSAATLVLRGAGPVILTSPAALPMALLTVACIAVAASFWRRLSGINPSRPLALAFMGAYAFAWERASAAATGPRMRRLWGGTLEAARSAAAALAAAAATARASGSAGTAPTGTPARS